MIWLFCGLLASLAFALTGLIGTFQAINHVNIPPEVGTVYVIVFAVSGFCVFLFAALFMLHTLKLRAKYKEQARKLAAKQKKQQQKELKRKQAIAKEQRLREHEFLKLVHAMYKLKMNQQPDKYDQEMLMLAMSFADKGDMRERRVGVWYILLHKNRHLTEMLTKSKDSWIRQIATWSLKNLDPIFLEEINAENDEHPVV